MVALAKGISLTGMGVWVLGVTPYHVLVLWIAKAEIMGSVGLLALSANVISVLLLAPYRDGVPMSVGLAVFKK